MIPDPNLPGQLKFAASRIDDLLADPLWPPFRGSFPSVDVVSQMTFLNQFKTPGMWVGRARREHDYELAEAMAAGQRAHAALDRLAATLRTQAQVAETKILLAQTLEQLIDLLDGPG